MFFVRFFVIVTTIGGSREALGAEKTYEFSTETFQLGRWSPKTLSYQQGLQKLGAIDQWYRGLTPAEREKQIDNYTLNRNRLFLVTQEKRLRSEIDGQTALSGLTENGKAVRKERSIDFRTLQKMSDSLLDDPARLTGRLLRGMGDIVETVNPEVAGAARLSGSAFMTNISKGSGGGSAGFMGFGETVSMLPRSTNNAYQDYHMLDFELDGILPADCKADKDCRAAKARIKARVEKRRLANERMAQRAAERDAVLKAKFKAEAEEFRKRDIVEREACAPIENSDYPLEAEFSSKFDENGKTGKLLQDLGISKVANPRKSNDLSNWFGEPTIQYDENGNKQATCAGHAIANNVAGALSRGKSLKLGRLNSASVSPDTTYALAKFHEGRADSPHDGAPDPSSAGYCDPKKYGADAYEGIEDVGKTLAKMTEVPLCAKSTAEATRDLYQVKKFVSAEFGPLDKPGFQAFKAMIDSGYTPIVHVDTETRTESAGWFELKTSAGGLEHVLNIVGYEEAIDPWTLCKTKVFIVRDSLGKRKVHYRVPVTNLIKHLKGVYQVTQVEAVRPGSNRNGDGGPSRMSPISR